MTEIPLVDLKVQYTNLKTELATAIQRVLDRTDFVLGEEVGRFEEEFAKFIGVPYAVGVSSGTDALKIILEALGVGDGDEVILPCNTFVATAYAVSSAGARPVFADIDETSFNLDIARAADRITPRTKAIIPVHLYGRPADIDRLLSLSGRGGPAIIEDACQAHGSVYKGKKIGSIGTAGAFSFYPGKNLGAYGDGGIITTTIESLARSAKMMRNYGQSQKYHHDTLGYNSRLDTIQAAILLVKLSYLEEWNKSRRRIARLYREALKGVPVTLPSESEDSLHVYHLYVIRTERRDGLLSHLHANGIGAGIHYPVPIHLQKAYAFLGYRKGDFPVAERVCKEILSLPIYPEMTESRVLRVAETIKGFFR
jgi:dTDP-4-amino-4,6-dideoxygalactose transaminase